MSGHTKDPCSEGLREAGTGPSAGALQSFSLFLYPHPHPTPTQYHQFLKHRHPHTLAQGVLARAVFGPHLG